MLPVPATKCVFAFRRLITAAATAVLCTVAVGFGAGSSLAQSPKPISPRPAAPASSPVVPTFQSLATAAIQQNATLVQLRRFRSDDGTVTTVREQLQVQTNGTADPNFSVTFLGVEGELPGSPLWQKWQSSYVRFGALFYRHSNFRVRDLGKAQANYSLHDFGPVMRAGRSARRMVIFPAALDKGIWVVDVDDQTQLVTYAAELDMQLRLLSEVDAQSLTPTVQTLASGSTSGVAVADFTAAATLMGAPAGIVDPNMAVASEYGLDRIEVRTDPLNGRQQLVMTYTDGVDQFLFAQAPGMPDPFAGLPSKNNQGAGNTIARYRDPAMSVLMFWDGGVSFQLAGRGGLRRLDELSRRLYLQALSTN